MFVAAGYNPAAPPSPFSRPQPAWHPPFQTAARAAAPAAPRAAAVPAGRPAQTHHAARVAAAKQHRRMRAAVARCRTGGMGDALDTGVSFTLPDSLTPQSEATQTAALNIPTSIAGRAALNEEIQSALFPKPAPTMTPYEQQLWQEGRAGYNIGVGLQNSDTGQVSTGIAQLPSSLAAMAKDNSPTLKLKWPKITVPWWAWLVVGALGVVLLKEAA